MTNVMRHARASQCDIEFAVSRDRLEMTVLDNGIGATDGLLEGHQSLGILGMKERAAAVGGALQVENGANAGVLVRACFPWRSEDAAAVP